MTEEILKKAIEKAVKNGWKNPHIASDYWGIIFSHDFAKAFWKSGKAYFLKNGKWSNRQTFYRKDTWTYFLKQMVIQENPIKYLEKFL